MQSHCRFPALIGAATLLAAALAGGGPVMAQDGHGHAAGHDTPAALDATAPAVAAYRDAMSRMHDAMAGMAYTGDADIDFARGMIPHHQAAIDMAEIVLEHGADPEIRALALSVIDAQAREIAELEAWLAGQGAD